MSHEITFGKEFQLAIAGESHSPWIDVKIYGLSQKETDSLDMVLLSEALKRRSPASLDNTAAALGVTKRREPDDFAILFKRPLTIRIFNKAQRSEDYDKQRTSPRPGHADLGIYYREKRRGRRDSFALPAGGGAFSGRMTVALVAAGSVASQVLKMRGVDLKIRSEITEIGGLALEEGVRDERISRALREAAEAGDALGCLVDFSLSGLPAGLGGPLSEGLDSIIAGLLFAIPGVKSVEFGLGKEVARKKASENNDPIILNRKGVPVIQSNNCGGLLGGLSLGTDITGQIAFKPTPSIEIEQKTVDLSKMEPATISTQGRHDRCIGLRGRVVVEAVLACASLDALLLSEIQELSPTSIEGVRKKISALDVKLQSLLNERFRLAEEIGKLKRKQGLAIRNRQREKALLESMLNSDYKESITDVYLKIMEKSRALQQDGGKNSGQNSEKSQFALLGQSIKHSYSPLIFQELGYKYDLLDVDRFEFEKVLKNPAYKGFNVTMPYKDRAYHLCDSHELPSPKLSSVNTICPEQGKLVGYNTDYECMLEMIGQGFLKDKSVMIIGKGNTGRLAAEICKKEGAASIVYKGREDLTEEELEIFSYGKKLGSADKKTKDQDQVDRVIINCSPVGTSPNFFESPIDLRQVPNCQAVFDVIYNPKKTALAIQAEDLNVPLVQTGLPMLIGQALASCEKFTASKLPRDRLKQTIGRKISKQTEHLILIGMPGSGKTSIGQEVAAELNRNFYDLDWEIERKFKRSAGAIIEEYGEKAFRKIETGRAVELFKKLAIDKEAAVIALGGGSVLSKTIMSLARQTGSIIFLDRPIEDLARQDRPLSSSAEDLDRLYENRISLYNSYCDIKIPISGKLEDAVCQTISEWREK